MKMVKSLLLGSAAGIVAIAGAQAADLPVKAKPVEYVKVCSLYGAGFYYMPGTDICLKIGGYVRFQMYEGNGSQVSNGLFMGTGGYQTRLNGQAHDFVFRARAVATLDTRQQTEYGTLRTYTLIGFNHDTPGSGSANTANNAATLYATRGFIQLAGFTVGKAQSFYDIWSSPAVSYFGTMSSDTGDGGVLLAGYTAQFGNGFTGTVSIEDPRRAAVVNGSLTNSLTGGVSSTGATTLTNNNPWIIGAPTSENSNIRMPDVVGVLRVDQAWGSAQIMAAVHDASGGYYGNTINGSQVNGHPDDKLGWVVGGGARLKADAISRGDTFQFQVAYTEGAVRYLDFTPSAQGSPFFFGSGNSLGLGWYTDGIYNTGSAVQLTKGFGANASYEHVWNQKWKTSLYGGYVQIKHNDEAKAIIATSTCGALAGAATGASGGSLRSISNCDPDWSQWFIGSRTQFNINSSTYLGLDVMYRKLNTAFNGTAQYTQVAGTARPSGAYTIDDQDAVSVTFRVHRDFLP